MENFSKEKTNLDAIMNYYSQSTSNNGTEYGNYVTEIFQNRSVLPSPSDRIDVIRRYLSVFGVILLSLFTLAGNLVIILSVRNSTNLNSTNYSVYIVSLAVADFCVGLLVMPLMLIYTYFGYWPLGNVACTLFIVIDHGVCTTSQVHLSAIAYDRLKSVLQPLVYRSTFTRGRALKICVCLWVGTFLFWTPGVLVTRALKEIDGTMVSGQCYYLPNKYYVLTSILVYYCITDVFLVTLAILLVCALRRRQITGIKTNTSTVKRTAKQHKEMGCTGDVNDYDDILNTAVPTDQVKKMVSPTTLDKFNDQSRRVIRTLVILIAAYGLCLMPWKVFWPILAFCNSCIPDTAFSISYWMSYANSFVNPCLYLMFNSDFRVAFYQLFCLR